VQYNIRQQGYDGSYQVEDGSNNRKIQVSRLIPKATIEAIPLPPVSEYDKRSEDGVIFKVEEPLPLTHGTKNETPHEKIVENPDDFPPKRSKPHITTTNTEKLQMNDNFMGTPSPKPSTFKENQEVTDSTLPETSTLENEEVTDSTPPETSTLENEEVTDSTPPETSTLENEELTETPPPPTTTTTTPQPPITSSSPSPPPPAHYIPYQYSPPYYGPPPPPLYPYDDYHSPCVYGPHYYPPLDCRPPYHPTPRPHHRPPNPPKPYGGLSHKVL
jgi:hypothetical protein